jgi:polyphosphate:AMP phosphotransferase
VIARVHRQIKRSAFDTELDRIARFEQMLAADGAVFVKLWLHLPRKVQKKRLKKLEAQGRIAPDDWKHFKLYDRFTEISERAVRRTDTGAAPWHVIEATDRRYREFTAGAILLEALEAALARPAAGAAAPSPPPEAGAVAVAEPAAAPAAAPAAEGAVAAPPAEARRSILDHVDLSPHLAEAEYEEQLEKQQKALGQLAWKAHAKGRSVVLVFEGWDAAGKGSAIRRVTQAIDPRLHRVVGIAAPTDEERAQHYLWRFWRHLPRAGFMTIFDRSWYGRVLVERVEGFARPDEWNRAYHEINEFEEELVEHGVVVNKFWLHISPAEQLRRFNERETVAYKRYKITDEDWRNRKKWDDYKAAVDEMVARCGTEYAPWTIVPANDKRFARIQILKTINQQLRAAL